MDFKQLETFVTIVKHNSFSKAAEELFLTQPTISNHIQNLEKELSTLLINRNTKNISLTKAGKILYKHAIEILNKRDIALFSLNDFRGKIEGILEISASTIPAEYFLPEIICKFNKKYPHVQYHLKKYDTEQVIEKILMGDIDFGIVGGRIEHNKLTYLEIMEDNIVLIAPNNCKFQMNSIKSNLLYDIPLIFREKGSGTRRLVEDALLKKDIEINKLKIIAFIENTSTIKEFVRRGLASSFISAKAFTPEDELKQIEIEDLDLKRKFYFVFHNNRALSPLAQTFRDFVLETLA